jgi:hypothetical protein
MQQKIVKLLEELPLPILQIAIQNANVKMDLKKTQVTLDYVNAIQRLEK